MQEPSHSSIFRPVLRTRYRPRLRSGAKMTGRSAGICRMIASAFDDVQITSESAFTSALQLM